MCDPFRLRDSGALKSSCGDVSVEDYISRSDRVVGCKTGLLLGSVADGEHVAAGMLGQGFPCRLLCSSGPQVPFGRRLQFLRRSVTTASPAFRASSPHRARRRWKILSGEACKGLEKAVVQHHSRVGPLVECEASWAPSASLETSSAGLTKHSRSERWSHATVCVAHVDKPAVTCASGSVNAHTELSDE